MRVKYVIEIHQDKKKDFRWRIKRSGRIVAESGEGYKRKATMLKTIAHLIDAIQENSFMIQTNTIK